MSTDRNTPFENKKAESDERKKAMSTETDKILEGNKLIAEFMGAFLRDMGHGDMVWDHASYMSPVICKGQYELEYHSSWSWLMPVVEKIESLGDFYIGIDRHFCMIGRIEDFGKGKKPILPTVAGISKINATYNQVLNFIHWYNKNTPHG